MMRRLLAASLSVFAAASLPVLAEDGVRKTILDFSSLNGWDDDDHKEALKVFLKSCKQIPTDGWEGICKAAADAPNAKEFFELAFIPVLIEGGEEKLFTAYYEPELRGSRMRQGAYQYPLYALPPEAPRGKPWLTREQLEKGEHLAGRGLEIAWLSDPVEAFFLHVQGSGRLRLSDGSSMRVGFAGKNGYKYRSVGKEMARLGILSEHKVSAASIKSWVKKNPERGRKMLWHNPSYVFFRELTDLPPDSGPIGAMSVPITTMRTIAVDPEYTPLGAPVWIEKDGKTPIRRLMVAQDTGSAIVGGQRADIYFGSGDIAGDEAGRIRDDGRMITLLPRSMAHGL